MSDVSPDSSVSNISVQVAMPEFPFAGKLDPASITPQVAEVLKYYYDACKAVASWGAGRDVVNSPSAASSRSRVRRRRRPRGSRVSAGSSVQSRSVQERSSEADLDGLCYLKLVVESRRREARAMCGLWPSFSALLAMPALWLDVGEVEKLNLVRAGAERFHLTSAPGPSVKCTLAGLAGRRKSEGGTVSELAATWQIDRKLVDYLPSERALLGGSGQDVAIWLSEMSGENVESFVGEDLAVVSNVSANLPVASKQRLRLFEVSGDSALTMAVATKCLDKHLTAQAYQEARSVVTSNPTLARVYSEKVPKGLLVFPAGVDPGKGKAGANALEAFIGYVYLVAGMRAVVVMCERLGLFDQYDAW